MTNYYSFVFHIFKFKFELADIINSKVTDYDRNHNSLPVPRLVKFALATVKGISKDQIYRVSIGSLYVIMLSFLVVKFLGQ